MLSQVSGEFASMFTFIMVGVAILLGVVLTAITLVAFCKVCMKAGYSWAWGLLVIVPFGNLIVPLFLAFTDWPVHRELRHLRQHCGGTSA